MNAWLFKEYDFVLADLNMSVFTTLCCQMRSWRSDAISYLATYRQIADLNLSIFYNILVSDRHDLLLSVINLLSDRRSDANTIHIKIGMLALSVHRHAEGIMDTSPIRQIAYCMVISPTGRFAYYLDILPNLPTRNMFSPS